MAMFKLPRLKANLAIVNGQGKPLDYFLRFWNIEVAPRIEAQEISQDEIIQNVLEIQQAQAQQLALINQALELAGLALGQEPNTETETMLVTITDDWELGPEVEFASAVDPETITIAGSGVYVVSGAEANFSSATGQLRLVEIDGGETVIGGPWNFTVSLFAVPPGDPQAIIITNPPQVASYSSLRANSGTIRYRIDAKLETGQVLSNVQITTTVRRPA